MSIVGYVIRVCGDLEWHKRGRRVRRNVMEGLLCTRVLTRARARYSKIRIRKGRENIPDFSVTSDQYL